MPLINAYKNTKGFRLVPDDLQLLVAPAFLPNFLEPQNYASSLKRQSLLEQIKQDIHSPPVGWRVRTRHRLPTIGKQQSCASKGTKLHAKAPPAGHKQYALESYTMNAKGASARSIGATPPRRQRFFRLSVGSLTTRRLSRALSLRYTHVERSIWLHNKRACCTCNDSLFERNRMGGVWCEESGEDFSIFGFWLLPCGSGPIPEVLHRATRGEFASAGFTLVHEGKCCYVFLHGGVHTHDPVNVHGLALSDGDYHGCVLQGPFGKCSDTGWGQCGVPINKCSIVGVLKLGHEHRTVSIAHYHPGVGNIVCVLKILSRPAMNETGEHSSFNVERLRHHIHLTRQSDAHNTGCCGEEGLDDASHLRADASVRKCAIQKDLTFRIECRTIVDEGNYGVPTLSKHHGDKPVESTNVVSAPLRQSESSLGVWQVTVQYLHQSASNDSG